MSTCNFCSPKQVFFFGVINAGGIDFLSGCLLPMHVSRDTRPCVRSISWSPVIGSRDNAESECPNEPLVSSLRKERKGRRQNETNVAAKKLDNVKENNTWEIIPISVSEGTPLKIKECNVQLITAQQYASRNAMLTPLIVAWSSILRTSEDWVSIPHNSSGCCSILATGLKCGLISFWRIDAPESYSIITPELPCKSSNGGFLKAHDTCITSICWALYGSEISKPQLLLATGSFKGKVKIWQVNIKELLKSFETVHASFSLLREVTGLAWAFDGLCLYSCSQDNSMKAWNLVGKALREIHIPSNTPGLNSSLDVPYVYDSCFGLAVSHGSLAIAVAQRFDSDLLNLMYKGRTQKAAIEFLWIGGQQLDTSSNICFDIDFGSFPVSLSGLLNIWEIVAALMSFKQPIPNYVEHILQKWLTSYFGSNFGICITFLSTAFKILPTLSTRNLHLINVIIRHVVLKNDELCCENEVRRRLVGLYFSAILDLLSDVPTNFCDVGFWRPDEWPQLEHYISLHEKIVEDDLKFLAAKFGKIKKRRRVLNMKNIAVFVQQLCHLNQ
ncbi:uncharacterized protein [Primulina eburnea]|uniref:uncharacterized protein n=1 Tax=Primulina eburnea TaxID=1245227 RepID=UPI003C6BDC41